MPRGLDAPATLVVGKASWPLPPNPAQDGPRKADLWRGSCYTLTMFSRVQPSLFWAHVDRPSPTSCWLWTGRSRRGHRKQYGSYSVRLGPDATKAFGAHRVAYALHHELDSLPSGAVVQHDCDTPLCCNPTHLTLGTHQTNAADMWAKGRGSTGPRPGRFPRRVTDAQLAAIRTESRSAVDDARVAGAHGLSRYTVRAIRLRHGPYANR